MAEQRIPTGQVEMAPFEPDDRTACVPAWQDYKREFRIRLIAAGLGKVDGDVQVNNLLKCMGLEAMKLYETFVWAPAVAAVAADPANGVEARAAVPAEDKNNLEHVFKKFDNHWGVQKYRSLKRQEFLDTVRGPNQPVMDFIAELRRKAEHCDYGAAKEDFICDKIINAVNDEKISERLLELPDEEVKLNKVIQVCRQVELTAAHLKVIKGDKGSASSDEKSSVNHVRQKSDKSAWKRGRARGRARGRGDTCQSNSSRSSDVCDKCCLVHQQGQCKASYRRCDVCGEKGHYAKSTLCSGRNRNMSRGRGRSGSWSSRDRGQSRWSARPGRGQGRDNSYGYGGYSSHGFSGFRGRSHRNFAPRGRGRYVHYVDDFDDYDMCEQFDNLHMEDVFHFSVTMDNSNIDDVMDNLNIDDVMDNSNIDDVQNVCDAQNVCDGAENVCIDVQDVCDDVRTVDDNVHDSLSVDDVQNDESVANVEVSDVCQADTRDYRNEWSVTFDVMGHGSFDVELDTGAQCNVINVKTVEALGLLEDVKPSFVILNGVHNQAKRAMGSITIPCVYRGVTNKLLFQVLESNKVTNLLGRQDCTRLGLIARVNVVVADPCKHIVSKYKDVIGDEIGCLPGEYDIKIDENVSPVVHPPRPLPVAIRDQVRDELSRLEKIGVIAKVDKPTKWVNSMVVVRKKDDKVRICIDPTDLNKAIKREHFPMNSIEDISTRLYGSKVFSTLDANSGYFQVKLSEQSSDLTTFNTPFGRFKYLRMPMGAKCSAEVFQREMMNCFSDLDGVEIVVDDILVHGKSWEEHNDRLVKVLDRARKINLKLSYQKSQIGLSEVTYVGHRLTGEGLKPTDERVKAIKSLPRPTNLQELQTVLGMISYVSKFIPNMSEINAPLRDLKTQEWNWGKDQESAFVKLKSMLTSNTILQYYDVTKPVLISVDASMRGLGAAMIQENKVVAYASRSLTPTQQRYAQIEKEALAVVFGCSKFHKYIYGKPDVKIESDHKPLENILKKPIHNAPMRIQRMLLKLQPYSFSLVYTKGKDIGLADCLSRFPCTPGTQQLEDDLMICKIDTFFSPQHEEIVQATQEDEELVELKRIIFMGWPEYKNDVPVEIRMYWGYREELSTYNGVVYKGNRVVVPKSLRSRMVKMLHKSHLGMVGTKQRARDLVFWPSMNAELEEVVVKCEVCLRHRNKQQKEPLIVHSLPDRPWSKVGGDLFELDGLHFVILVDYYSNFIEIEKLSHLSTSAVVKAMKRTIARHGIMDTFISDNGPQFSSAEFASFMEEYGIQHLTSSPYRPQSNGLAEKSVQTIKRMMMKCHESGEDFYLALLDYHNTPRENMGSPAQRLMGRRTKTRIPTSEVLLKPQIIEPGIVYDGLQKSRVSQKFYYDRGSASLPRISEDDAIRIHTENGWEPAEYIDRHRLPRSYVVKSGPQARLYRRNRNDLMITQETPHRVQPAIRRTYPYQHASREPSQGNISSGISGPGIPNVLPNVPQLPMSNLPTMHSENYTRNSSSGRSGELFRSTTTRSGRVTSKPSWMTDMVNVK